MIILCLIVLFGLLIMPRTCMTSAADALSLCTGIVIPSLFPFLVCSRIMILSGFVNIISRKFSRFMKPVFNVNGSGAFALMIGILSGYPVGAKVVASLYEQGSCTKTEAERMLAFCNNSGPLFIIGAVGTGIFKSPRTGFYLYAAHVLSALTVGIIFRFYKHRDKASSSLSPSSSSAPDFGSAFQAAIYDSLKSLAIICGYVVFFAVIIALLNSSGVIPLLSRFANRNLLIGIIEITNGITAEAPLPIVGFLLAWSGLSVIMQVSGIISAHRLSIRAFISAKLLQGLFGAIYTSIIVSRFAQPVFSMQNAPAANLAEAFVHTFIQIMYGITLAMIIAFLSQLLSSRKR